MFTKTEAIARLLSDDDPDTVDLVKQQLIMAGQAGLQDLRELFQCDDVRVTRHLHDVVASIRGKDAFNEFALFCHFFGEHSDLEQALWTLAQAISPEDCIEPQRHFLNELGREYLVRVTDCRSSGERIRCLSRFLAEDMGFRGNMEDYYCPRNSLLHDVLRTRTGLPILLSLVYMMVAARAAVKIEGINLPGHFIVRHGGVYFDPFHGGRILDIADIECILLRQGIELRDHHLRPATPRQVLLRVLCNLLHVFDLREDSSTSSRIRDWIAALNGCCKNS